MLTKCAHARDQHSIFSMVRKFCPDYWLLLELHTLTLVTRSYAFVLRDMANGRPQNTTQHIAIQPESCAPSDFELWIGKFVVCYCLLIIPLSAQASDRFKCQIQVPVCCQLSFIHMEDRYDTTERAPTPTLWHTCKVLHPWAHLYFNQYTHIH